MKTIIALTFIGILTYAFAEEPSDNKTCGYKPMENFDSTRYLQITTPLYSTHSMDESDLTVCKVIKSITKSNGKVDTNIHGYYRDGEQIYYYEMVCHTTEGSFETGQYLSDCKIVKDTYFEDPSISSSFKIYKSIIDTDYQNYAIVYTCRSTGSGIEENVVVLEKDPGTSNDLIKEALTKLGTQLEYFNDSNPTYCQNGNKEKQET